MRRLSLGVAAWCVFCQNAEVQVKAFQTPSTTIPKRHYMPCATRGSCRQNQSNNNKRPKSRQKERAVFPLQSLDHEDSEKSGNSNNPTKRLKAVLHYIQYKQQYAVVLLLYLFHLSVLTQHELVFPVQLLPSKKGHFTGIGWDSLAGVFTLGIYKYLRLRRSNSTSLSSSSAAAAAAKQQPLPTITSNPINNDETPWNLPRDNPRYRLTSVVTALVLIRAYFTTGEFSIFWEDLLYDLSGLGFFITAPMQRSLCVLLGHLSWLTLGALLLRWLPRPPKFFQPANHVPIVSTWQQPTGTPDNQQVNSISEAKQQESVQHQRPYVWFRSSRQSKWLWWVIGGYFVSSLLFNVADVANQYILPHAVLEEAQESVVSQLVNPEHNDWLASAVGYIAPCITAPWWEEILYRGFCLPGMTQLFGYKWAVFLQGVVFSAHHMSLSAALPLAVLGWTWAILYTKSKNLWVVVAVHALWNSRVFLGSWLGL